MIDLTSIKMSKKSCINLPSEMLIVGFFEGGQLNSMYKKLNKRFDDAIINYEKAISIQPDYADAWYNKAELLKHQGLEDEANNCFNKVKEIEGTN